MAFNFDWTPLGAVGNLAIAAGRNKAAAAEADFMLKAKSLNLADARARDELRLRKNQSERGFQLQLAESDRQSRKLDMQARAMDIGASQYQEARTTRDANLQDWESIKDQLRPDEYTRGLIAIRAGKTPPQLATAQQRMQTFDDDLDRLRKLQMATASYQKTLEGYRLDTDGKTWRAVGQGWFGSDPKVDDPALVERLNEANTAMQDISSMRKLANEVFQSKLEQTAPADNAPKEDKLRYQVERVVDAMSEPDQVKAMRVIELYGPEEFLRMKQEADRKQRAQGFNQQSTGAGYQARLRMGGL